MSHTRRTFLHGALAGAAGRLRATAAQRKPNIIVILADDLGYADVGFNGCRDIPTPNLDSLARTGVRFTNGCVSHPFCSPTRAGIMTGRYQQRFGHENNPRYDPRDEVAGLPVDEATLAQVLGREGYKTGLVGKWHLGAAPPLHPMRRGFQEMFGFLGGGHDYFKVQMDGEPREYLIPIHRDGKPEALREYLTDELSREAAAFVRRHRADPFFLYLTYNAPHTPLQSSERYLARFAHVADEKRRTYAAMLSAVDDGVGQLLAALRESQVDSDTLVFFLSDNGGPVGINGSSNHPLRGAKGSVFEGGIRVPFVARWRGNLPEGKDYHEPVISLDIFSTALAAAGAPPPAGRKIDGANLLPFLKGEAKGAPHQRLFWRTGGGVSWAVREGRHKLLKTPNHETMLFDLQSDLGETSDLAAKLPREAARLREVFEAWNRELIPPRFESPRAAPKKKS